MSTDLSSDPNFAGGVYSVLPQSSREGALAKRDSSALLEAWAGKSERFLAQLEACRQDLARELFAAMNSHTADKDLSLLFGRIAALLLEFSTIAGMSVAWIANDNGKTYAQTLQSIQMAVAQMQAQVRASS